MNRLTCPSRRSVPRRQETSGYSRVQNVVVMRGGRHWPSKSWRPAARRSSCMSTRQPSPIREHHGGADRRASRGGQTDRVCQRGQQADRAQEAARPRPDREMRSPSPSSSAVAPGGARRTRPRLHACNVVRMAQRAAGWKRCCATPRPPTPSCGNCGRPARMSGAWSLHRLSTRCC